MENSNVVQLMVIVVVRVIIVLQDVNKVMDIVGHHILVGHPVGKFVVMEIVAQLMVIVGQDLVSVELVVFKVMAHVLKSV